MGGGAQLKIVRNGEVFVVAPTDLKETIIPLFCPLCHFPMLTREDGHSYRKLNCCDRCEMRWGSSKKLLDEDFELVKKTDEWKEYVKDRLKRSRQLIKLK